jgi:hypothetical protein
LLFLFTAAELLIIWLASWFEPLRVNSHFVLMHLNRQEGWCQPVGEARMLWTVFAILLLLWLLGWGFHVAGSLIHLILVIALIVLLVEVITGRRAAI